MFPQVCDVWLGKEVVSRSRELVVQKFLEAGADGASRQGIRLLTNEICGGA